MNAAPDPSDLDFTKAFDRPANPLPSLAAVSESQRNEAKAEAVKLRDAGYCINIVRPAPKVAPLPPGAETAAGVGAVATFHGWTSIAFLTAAICL